MTSPPHPTQSTEYAIVHHNNVHELHRGPMTEAEADQWIAEFCEDGGKPDTFFVVCREVGPWGLA